MKVWRTQKNKPGNKQAASAAQTKAPPAAQKYQATPTRIFPHPPHQWGGSVAQHAALSVSKPQHPSVRQRKFPTPSKIEKSSHPCTAAAPALAPPKQCLQRGLRKETVSCHATSQAKQYWWVKFYMRANCMLMQAAREWCNASWREELREMCVPSCTATARWTSAAPPESSLFPRRSGLRMWLPWEMAARFKLVRGWAPPAKFWGTGS